MLFNTIDIQNNSIVNIEIIDLILNILRSLSSLKYIYFLNSF